jgi:bifunctional UDP-N-acetylglucosamine pyrophosphorylase / glucosamine-1-phosphate N-acetyltransferase
VLAAGLGTRMKSRVPKVLHALCGRPMLEYVLDAADGATGSRPIVVYSPATEQVRDAVAGRADTALQDEPRGTGDAVRAALAALSDEIEEVLVLSGDVPLVKADLLRALLEARALDHAAMALVAVDALDPTGLGRVVRTEGGTVERIVEDKDATDEERQITEINAGLYAFDAAWLRRRIPDLEPSATTAELYLTDLVAMAREDGRLVAALEVDDDGRLTGINDRSQLARAEWDMRVELNDAWMKAGVTMVDPSTVYLDHTVELAEDVILEPGVILRGATRIGARTRIATGSQLHDTVVGEDCVIWASILERSTVEDEVTIGPFSHLRPGAHIGTRSEIGNYAEIKNSRLGTHVRQHHMSYLGDAEVGAETNVGAGTITANYDGVAKHRTTIGEGVFLGVDTMLRAPVTLGDGSKTGAGSVVTRDVPAGKLAVGVPARIREIRPHARDTVPEPGDGAPSKPAPEGDPA